MELKLKSPAPWFYLLPVNMNPDMPFTINHIYVYPVKGLAPVEVEQTKCISSGLEYDRRWFPADKNGNFITARNFPELLLFKTKITDNDLFIEYRNYSIKLNIKPVSADLVNASVWNDHIKAIEAEKSVSEWFSEMLKTDCRLLYIPDNNMRKVQSVKSANSNPLSASDGYPILILGSESVKQLSRDCGEALHHLRFRPNIYIETKVAFEEDSWNEILIGNTLLLADKPCARCVMVNIDPFTAQKNENVLKTLSVKRKSENKVLFGVNTLVVREGIIKRGQHIELI